SRDPCSWGQPRSCHGRRASRGAPREPPLPGGAHPAAAPLARRPAGPRRGAHPGADRQGGRRRRHPAAGMQREKQPGVAGLPGDPQGVSRTVRKEPRGANTAPHQLGAPLPHSSLALEAEVRATRKQPFDARQAAEQLVQRSFVARCTAEACVGEGLNIPREQQLYRGLISLQVPADQVLNSAVQERLALVQYHPKGPDLMAFYRPGELFTETPALEVGGLPPMKLQAQKRPPDTTFLMHRKLQQWAS
uniref:Protein phosphatase 1 regulatory subunit 35 n=1 Tax=Pseudonaja textilis TaxID=8673 RepID=A0A670ZCD5_PSETE